MKKIIITLFAIVPTLMFGQTKVNVAYTKGNTGVVAPAQTDTLFVKRANGTDIKKVLVAATTPTIVAGSNVTVNHSTSSTTNSYTINAGSTSLANEWHLTGNSGTTAGTNFAGTIDSVDYVLKTNNRETANFYGNKRKVFTGTQYRQVEMKANGDVAIGYSDATSLYYAISLGKIGMFVGSSPQTTLDVSCSGTNDFIRISTDGAHETGYKIGRSGSSAYGGMFIDWLDSTIKFEHPASPTPALRLFVNEDVVIGNGAIATNATSGFLYIPTCAGTPTGTPDTHTGNLPIIIDSTNNKMYIYSGGAWRILN